MKQLLQVKMLLLFGMFLLGAGVIQAQVTSSSIRGNVVDEAGELLIGATVKATHEPSGSVYGAVTSVDGRFNLANLRVGGPYTLEVSYIGFQTIQLTNINLSLGQPYSVDIILLDDEAELEMVVVTSNSLDDFNASRTGAATNVGQKAITDLPQINRSVLDFTRLTPQASGNSFAGRDARYNNLQIDGANFNNGFGLSSSPLPGGSSQPISLDAVEEITVNIAPFDVTQSGFTGAGINAVTKSGTNTFKGSAYYFLKNQDLQGRQIGSNELEKVDAASRNFGFRLGGPIIKNKLFFFVNAEREVQTGANASGANLWRASTDGVADPENNIARPTVDDLESVRNHLINQWGYDPGRYEGYANEAEQSSTKFLARVDWNINDKHKLAVRYNQVVGEAPQVANATSGPRPRAPFPNGARVSQNAITFENGNYGFENSVKSITAELNSYFSAKLSNQFLATYSRIQDTRTTPGPEFPFVDIWDGGGFIEDEDGNMVKNVGSMNYISFGTELFSYNNDVVNDNYSFINNLTYVEGSHTFTAGAAFEIQKFGNSYVRMGTSYYRYASVEDFLTTGTVNEVAPTLFGLTYPYEGRDTYSRINFGLASLYAQDKFSVNENLDLTFGLRAELPIYLNDLTANQSIDEITLLNKYGMPTHYSSGEWPKSKVMVSPRFGFNWDVNGDRTFTLRGGTGVFSGRVPFVWLTNMPTNAGVIQNNIEPGDYDDVEGWIDNVSFQTDKYYYVNNVPEGAEDVFISSPSEGAPGSFALVDREFKMPMVWRSSLGADYVIPNTPLIATADLLYTRDINGVFQYGANRTRSTNTMNYGASGVIGDYGDDREFFVPGQSNAYNPVMGGNNATILTNTDVKGHSFSATFGLTMPDYKGLSASVYYTYSSAKEVSANSGSNASSAWGASPVINSPNDQMLNISDFATPHRVVASVNYKVEYANALATTIGLYYSGANQGRFSYTYGDDINNDGINADLIYLPRDTDDLPLVDGDFSVAEQKAALDAFIEENGLDKYRGEYLPRNAFLLPWLNRWDVRVLQDIFTDIGDNRSTLQLSVDIVNVGNLLNSDWGVQDQLNGAENLLQLANDTPTSGVPALNVQTVSDELVATPFRNVSNLSTTWGMQVGLRLIF
ncbi:TonB-dependent receptor [Echinicola marina]|uniref:TonB-dependent receptor n=1 Tax=Echinicola marina TaxID=2859768 RepID=UPI001CF70C7F|nr:TonB-dependent receptor [Echinicola marina]UCS94288.1 TonB-dependent receptor [Echinicola marina]